MTYSSTNKHAGATSQVRAVHASDLPQLYRVCLQTAAAGVDATQLFNDPDLPGQLYMAPYFAHEPAHAFTLVLQGQPAGYIVGTADSCDFSAWMNAHWWPILQAGLSHQDRARSDIEALMQNQVLQPVPVPAVAEQYPAHLHINLLPQAQGSGHATLLMNAFLASLEARQVGGVHLILSETNQRALKFYTKQGFRQWHESAPGTVTMVRNLSVG